MLPDGSVDAAHPVAAEWLAAGKTEEPVQASSVQVPDRAAFLSVKFRKQVAEAARLESRNARDDGRLIAREPVRGVVFGLLSELNRRLLTDASSTIATRMIALVRSGGTHEQCRDLVRSIVSSQIKVSKRRVLNTFDSPIVRATDNPAEVRVTERVEQDATRAIDAFAAELRPVMASVAAPAIIEAVSRSVARASGPDGQFSEPVFARVLEALQAITPDAVRQAGVMLVAHVDATAAKQHQKDPTDETDPAAD